MSDLLTIEKLSKSYHDGQRELVVLKNVDLTVQKGEAIAIVGMSGAGKSTMLHLLGGLDRPDEGSLVFEGKRLNGASRVEMDTYRNRAIGFVFQFHHLLPEFTALENVMMPALVARRTKAEATEAATKLLEQVGLKERMTHRPSKLSGGEQQRVALARSLVNGPDLLLADEPTGNLDAKTGKKIIELMWATTVEKNRSLVIVTHEPTIAERADRIFHLGGGQLKQIPKEELKRNMVWG